DAALANGWLSEAEHRAGRAYALIWRRARIGGPAFRTLGLSEARGESDDPLAALRIRDMNDAQIHELWELAFGETAPAGEAAREASAAAALARWRKVNAALDAAAQGELFAVCIQESWPQWLCHRLAGAALSRRAAAEKRPLTDAELAHIAHRFASGWERKHEALRRGLASVGRAMRRGRVRAGAAEPELGEARRSGSITAQVVETAAYVDPEGTLLFTVERRGRR
ncbi:MAG: hypothetical protein ACREEW_04445, partial [Caulobacteraceae bacterium]